MNWQDANQVVPILKFFVRGGPAYCFWMAAKYAPEAFKDIDTYFTEHQIEAPSAPVSCASILAQKLGMSEMHQTMAAGFAGGIGLSGGGCGALGAAVWKHTMESGEIEMEGFAMNNPGAQAAIDRFVQASDYEFECAEIVGRKFEDVNDHAEYVREGGCAKIIEAIAAQSPAE
jgi:hypothetical protein